MILIETVTTTGDPGFIDLQNIPQTFETLVLKISYRASSTGELFSTVNDISGNTDKSDQIVLRGTGSAVNSSSFLNQAAFFQLCFQGSNDTANTFANIEMTFPSYANDTNFKSISMDLVEENNATSAEQKLIAGIVKLNNPITSIQFALSNSNFFVAGSTFSLYGIKSS